MVRTKQVNIRVSAEEYAALMAEAEKAGMQVAAFVRDAALRKRIKAAPPAINADAWITLGKTLNNLNQIARHLNAAARLGGEDAAVDEVRQELETLRREIQAVRQQLMEALK